MAMDMDDLMELAFELHQRGRLDEAGSVCREVLAREPDDFDALHLLGLIEIHRGRSATAVELIERAVAIDPDVAFAQASLGVALHNVNRTVEALARLDRALALAPDSVEVLVNRGNILRALKRPEDALASYDRAVQLAPGLADASLNRGNALRDLRRHAEALAAYEHTLALEPNHAVALCNAALALVALNRPLEALQSAERALAVKADYPEALSTRGSAHYKLGQWEQALECHDRALALKPDYADASLLRGNALKALKRLGEALTSYDKAIALKPDYADAYLNKSLALLVSGDFAAGWPLHEYRWKTTEAPPQSAFLQSPWLGAESVAGKTVLLHSEQGLGDSIQFCRYAKLVAALGGKVLLRVPRPLVSLFRDLDGVSQLLTEGDAIPHFDYHCPLLSLPLAFQTTLETIPAAASYLRAEPAKVRSWQKKLGEQSKPRIAIVWSGSAAHSNDRNRSLTLAEIAPLLSPDYQWLSLQRDVREVDQEGLSRTRHLLHAGGELQDFSDTAALCELMNVVISVDTGVAHLAGALGKPVWILLPFEPDWRWLLDREDSPWYPTARLYRQPRSGDWHSVFEKAREDLALLFRP